MNDDEPDLSTLKAAIALSVRAPSVHNTQSWAWRFSGHTIELRADPSRRLTRADPTGRDLLVSCGCALHHLRVAAAALGWKAEVTRLPPGTDPDLLAFVELRRREPSDEDIALASAIASRRSDRRPFTTPPTGDELARLANVVAGSGAVLETDARSALVVAAARAHELLPSAPTYLSELAAWSGHRYRTDGVLSRNTAPDATAIGNRRFAAPGLAPGTAPTTRH
ncbi:hypothetical protein AB0K15_39210 [Amycolatopsis sp. NPDC049253]|uniref:hypothetical protein n=1 Tax=Amycolatopsis sp. NPDC049253 TaxID=3155274 RepID=UPI0034313FAE